MGQVFLGDLHDFLSIILNCAQQSRFGHISRLTLYGLQPMVSIKKHGKNRVCRSCFCCVRVRQRRRPRFLGGAPGVPAGKPWLSDALAGTPGAVRPSSAASIRLISSRRRAASSNSRFAAASRMDFSRSAITVWKLLPTRSPDLPPAVGVK